ncbi:MAG: Holliday junction resolvase RuvX [Planctomycetota bacterium]
MTDPRRFIGVDLGDKRTGLALGDSVTRLASPASLVETPIDERDGDALLDALDDAIGELVDRGDATLVIGLPLNMDGTEGARAKLTRAFAQRLSDRTGRPIEMHDERRTSLQADERLARTGLTHKQKKLRRDAIAASAMLQAFLDALPREPAGDAFGDIDDFGPSGPSAPDRPANDW